LPTNAISYSTLGLSSNSKHYKDLNRCQ